MDKSILKGLEKFIGFYSRLAKDKLQTFSPVAILSPVDMCMDRYSFDYWPNGYQHGADQAVKDRPWNDIVPLVKSIPDDALISIEWDMCSEWLVCHVLYANRRINVNGRWIDRTYTEEQAGKYKQNIMKECPWVECLWNGEQAGDILREFLTQRPQVETIRAKYLKESIEVI